MVEDNMVWQPTSGPVARTLHLAGAFLMATPMEDRRAWFTWKSGVVAPVYTDCRRLARDAGATALVVQAMANVIRVHHPDAECIVGVAEAGVMWSALVAADLGLPHAFVRKARKEHGTGALVECHPAKGLKAVVVDDLMASGGSLEKAVDAVAQECRITTIGIVTIVNWNFHVMRERFTQRGIPFHALASYPELLRAGMQSGRLTRSAALELARFYRNPKNHEWDFDAFRDGKGKSA